MKKRLISGIIPLFLLASSCLTAAVGNLTVDVPKTTYIEWIANPTDPITQVNGSNTDSFVDYVGGPLTQMVQPVDKKTYLAVMCNSLAGYEIVMTASNSGATAATGNMTTPGGTDLGFNCTFTKVAASFTAGTTASASLDLTGATPSGSTAYAAEADLPMSNTAPNVWELNWGLPVISSISDGLIKSGTYTGGVTVTVNLK